MKNKALLFIVLAGLISCGKKEGQKENQEEVKVSEKEVATKECYSYTKNNDTITMTLIHGEGDKVSGDLVYNLYEKDGNFGTFQGIFKGDTLLIDYNFESEGMKSLREDVFLKKGDNLLRGYGEIAMIDGKQVIKQRKTIKFDEDFALTKKACE